METSTHRIRKQQWLVSAATANDAFALRKQIRERLEDTLEPIFNRAFDEACDNDTIIRIPRLEIKLKVKNDADLWENLPEALYEQITLQLQIITQKDNDSSVKETLAGSSIISNQYHSLEILIHYLNEGSLPWQVPQLSVQESTGQLKTTIQEQISQLIEYLINTNHRKAVFFRLFQLIPANRILVFVEQLLGKSPFSSSDDFKAFITKLLGLNDLPISEHSRITIASTLVSLSANRLDQASFAELMTEATDLLQVDKIIDLQKFIATLPEFSNLLPENKMPTFTNITDESLSNKMNQSGSIAKDSTKAFHDNSLQESDLMNNDLSDLIIAAMGSPVSSRKVQQAIRLKVQYAGLVILHPFLQRLFVQTEIVKEGEKIISFHKLAKAAALLHFMATGNDEIFEFELSFIKLLIGLNPEDPLLVSAGLLSSLEKEEVLSLLQAVIGHWSVLKNTSVEGLRQTFLQRIALLDKTDLGWTLQVEPTAFDILINRLPWSFTIIKFPWMKKPIYTQWETI